MQDTQQSKRKQMTTTNNRKAERQPVTAVWRNGGLSASYDSFVVKTPLCQATNLYSQW